MVELLAAARVPPKNRLLPARLLSPRTLVVAVLATVLAPAAAHAKTVSDEVVVGYKGSPRPHVVHTAHVAATIARYQRHGDVRYAVRNAVAHTSGAYMPDDPGRGTTPGRWAAVQWNFAGPAGVDAPDAWGHLIAAGHPGGQGVKIAVLDTGVAYRQFGKTPASPDLAGTRFVQGSVEPAYVRIAVVGVFTLGVSVVDDTCETRA